MNMIDNNENWEKRTITDEFRVKDIVEQYESLGFEVKVENYRNDDICNIECNDCLIATPEKFKVIFTRRAENFVDELF
jgi:uncharacterized protein YmfQ (DUF2313 family)